MALPVSLRNKSLYTTLSSKHRCSRAKGGKIQTTINEAYEELKLREGGESGEVYEVLDTTPTVTTLTRAGPTSAADLQEIYDTTLSASSEALPGVDTIPPEINEEEKDDDLYYIGSFLGRSELNYYREYNYTSDKCNTWTMLGDCKILLMLSGYAKVFSY